MIQGLIHDIENERRRNEPNINNLLRTQEKLSQDTKSNAVQQKMKNLYKMGLNDAAQEENLIRQALAKIQEIRTIRNKRRIQVCCSAGLYKSYYLQTLISRIHIIKGEKRWQQRDHSPWTTYENAGRIRANAASVC